MTEKGIGLIQKAYLRLLASACASLLHPPQGAEKRFKTSEILGVRE